jgi:large subunit ribosomal protein L18
VIIEMSVIIKQRAGRERRHTRIRAKVSGTAIRPRLCVFRSLNHIYAQLIDDTQGHTLVAASTLELGIAASEEERGTKTDKAAMVGTEVARRALNKGIKQVVFDRGGYKYHGRVKALAEAARAEGLQF